MSVSVIIPVFNEESSIKTTLIEIHEVLINSAIQEFDILVINDGSYDKTAQEIQPSEIPCQIITHKRNRGYGASLKTGLRHTKYGTIVIIDADGTIYAKASGKFFLMKDQDAQQVNNYLTFQENDLDVLAE